LLSERIRSDMMQAMKDRAAVRLSTCRLVAAEIKNRQISLKRDLTDDEVLGVVAAQVKKRRDAVVEFDRGNRPDLVTQAREEIAVLEAYLPAQLSPDELRRLVTDTISAVKAAGPRDMGKVMAVLMPHIKGRADGSAVSALVKELLT